MNKQKVKKIIRDIIYRFRQLKHDRFYRQVMGKNGIANKKVKGEKEWIEKWSQFGLKAKPTQYRVFSHYIGESIHIVPEDICHDFIETIINPMRFRGYYADKNIFDKLLPKGYLPNTILRRMNGFYYDREYNPMNMTEQLLFQILDNSGTDRIVIKPSVGSSSGHGVRLFNKVNELPHKWIETSTNEILNIKYIEKNYGSNFIVQEAVQQSDCISFYNHSSINTLRLSVYRSVIDNKCYVIRALMRIGGKGSFVDNTHAGGCLVGIHLDGSFCHEVCDLYGQKRSVFNGIDFTKDYYYPNWQEVVEFAKSVGYSILHHRLLALDIVLDKNNKPQLIEYNIDTYSTMGYQFTTGGALGDFTDEIINYCKSRQNEIDEILHL